MGSEKIIRNTRYYHPIRKSNNVATLLKHEMKCNDVVAHSHLKNNYEHNKAGDVVPAESAENIDVLKGAHSCAFMNEPVVVKNKNRKEVIINSAGWTGLVPGKIDVIFNEKRKQKAKYFSQKKI